ncbi:hypothetical protein [Williamsia sp. 1138]|uniref:hypothetical protein n=1 Tax=Williamsia sp. 1138 TaxID=1903117 RepID=UPI00117C6211|nr:hypothetical protein [Williamsia sp. 1138]
MSQRQEPVGCVTVFAWLYVIGLVFFLGKALLWAMFGQYGAGSAVAAWCGVAGLIGVRWVWVRARAEEKNESRPARPRKAELELDELSLDGMREELDRELRRLASVEKEIAKLEKLRFRTDFESSELRRLQEKRLVHDSQIEQIEDTIEDRTE